MPVNSQRDQSHNDTNNLSNHDYFRSENKTKTISFLLEAAGVNCGPVTIMFQLQSQAVGNTFLLVASEHIKKFLKLFFFYQICTEPL